MKILLLIILLSALYQPMTYARSDYIYPGEVWQDVKNNPINAHGGGIYYDNEYYYFYGEYRVGKSIFSNEWQGSNQKVNMYRSKDLVNWVPVGIVLDLSHLPENYQLERPKIIYNKKNKEYVMWFHLEKNRKFTDGSGEAGVATSKNITGPYTFISASYSNAGVKPFSPTANTDSSNWFVRQANKRFEKYFSRGQPVRDMALFVDDDEKAYLIYESEDNYSLQVARLSDDYKSFSGVYSRILVGQLNEAPSIMKYNNKYYLITSGLSGYRPNAARISVTDNILGPWITLGNPMSSFNSNDVLTSFHSQPTYILKVKKDKYIYLGDRWDFKNNSYSDLWKSTYVWLPINLSNEIPSISWVEKLSPD